MSIFEFILSVLLVYGITNIIVRGSIMESLKDTIENWHLATEKKWWKKLTGWFVSLTNCPMCTGFWVGALVGYFYGPYDPMNILFNGAIYSGTCWLLNCITTYLGQGNEPERSLTVYVHPESKLAISKEEVDKHDDTPTERILLNG